MAITCDPTDKDYFYNLGYSYKQLKQYQKAIDAFESGDAHQANIILNETEYDADRNLTDYLQNREKAILSIEYGTDTWSIANLEPSRTLSKALLKACVKGSTFGLDCS